ncbi:hypothetical protein [Tessaracoccus caeni]|uniref:hypothetical protein n=1 Tax=Tessaracoccus caeni TaxID=3031239 RepID=UPI0023D9A205|nr:hypothetical protein [Tessaracoccus caeni]MDF1489842.1 hypothetical protein [Tessaracoccus caeni]
MDIALLATIGLMLLIAGVSAGLWGRSHRLRPIVGGIGLLVVPLGLWLFGITDLAVNGVQSLIDWAQRTVWNDMLTWGAGLTGAGLLVFIISRFMPSEPKPAKPAAQQKAAPAPKPTAGLTGQAPKAPVAPPSATKSTPAAPQASGADAEDAEIEALLRKRGIM